METEQRPTYQFKTDPYQHQRQALRRSWLQPGFALLMEMGTGKTKVIIDEVSIYWQWDEIDAALILAPKGVYMNWVSKEIPAHMPDSVAQHARIVEWRPGGGGVQHGKRLERLKRRMESSLPVLVMNTEALSTPGAARRYVREFIQAHGRVYGAVDESTFIKNPDAARTREVLEIGQVLEYRRIATGSPVTRSPLDLYSQFEFLRPACLGLRSWFAFRARYAVLKKNHGAKIRRRGADGVIRESSKKPLMIVAYRNTEELTDKVAALSYRVTKDECLDLPPKIYTTRDVELTDEQARVYRELKEVAIADLSGGAFTSVTNVLTRLLRLQQVVCGHVTDDDGAEHDLPSNRHASVLEVLQEVSGKAIIWSRFRRDIQKLARALGEEYGPESVAQFHGGNTGTRQEDSRRFVEDDSCRWMISNQQSGGYGNTWLPGTTVIYFSNDFDLEKRLQSEDRPHRAGQRSTVTYVDLVARGTMDEPILAALRKKMNIAQLINGDNWREWVV